MRVNAGERDRTAQRADLARYLLPFGSSPFLPSEARASFSGFLKPEEVPAAAWCGQCHQGIYKQWRESAHANSFRTPWYTKNVNLLIEQKGIAFSRHCEGCHNPVALFSGVLTPDSTAKRPFDEDGVTCMTCHAIERVTATRGLGSYVLGRPAVMVDEAGKPMEGLPPTALILAHPERHKAALMRGVMQTPEFCGSCHKANLPQTLNGYKWLRAFTTYDEWQQSGWSRESPMAFFPKSATSTCQSCHMPKIDAVDVAATNGQVASHRWLGANTAIPTKYDYPDQLAGVTKFLRNKALRVDIFALSADKPATKGQHSSIGEITAPVDQSSFTLRGGQAVTVSVVVQNTGIGHSLVPEQRDFYESWIHFEARDEKGGLIYESGAVLPDQTLAPDTHRYTNQIISAGGERLNHHEVWKVEARAYDSTVNAGRADLERYRFVVPAGVQRVTVHAAVLYRRFRPEFLRWVFEDGSDRVERYPTVTMAEDTVSLAIGENSPAASAGKPDTFVRWTAYGIALLDRSEFAAAEAAFRRTIVEYPKRADGLINAGIVLYSQGRYVEALKALGEADRIDPENLRTRYYEGLCYRWQYRYQEAIRALLPVAKAYPRFRQVHDDLGWIYLIDRRYVDAEGEFEAALAVDPDDVVAHKWLAGVYTALGEKQKAADEAAQTAQMKDDPAALWRVLGYWRGNLDVAWEVTPGHVHGVDGLEDEETKRILNTQNPPSMVWIQH
ncbi:tetratricopeptide repeat protein [Granulicella sibirica]|uniref:Tetratricopeptide repeat protein n=1 Tax=Granulicella sibirica TaxID=2479048 RepID=A0A4V1L689_9BACT|nr:tetratricopeptide repeat protein [Granulicella sibirica]RXH58424.1 Tetratricopeptide repeat protein [Granulicella sibirica]